ncbi:MAG: hypothetical protein WCQ95_07265 [Bacteroidota bacterium]
MRKLFIGILVGILILLQYNCKKFEDGPYISFRSESQRIGTRWIVELFQINDVDQNLLYMDSCHWNFVFAEKYQHQNNEFYFENCLDSIWIFGRFYTTNHTDKLNIWSDNGFVYYKYGQPYYLDSTIRILGPICSGTNILWQIKRLTKKRIMD